MADAREEPDPGDERGTIPPADDQPEQTGDSGSRSSGDSETQQPLGDPDSDEESLRYKQLERDSDGRGES